LYDLAVFKDYFVSGQLSNRSFHSSGFEVGAGFSYQVSNKFGIYSQFSFNQKQTSFDYNIAITQSEYFNRILAGELIPIENIVENGPDNCFLANVKGDYKINSVFFSLGSTCEIIRYKKFSISANILFSTNFFAGLKMHEFTTLLIQEPHSESFNSLKVGAGLNIDYYLRKNVSIGISPMYYLQFNHKQSFYANKLKEMILPLNFKYYF
jgi:hypothetical protein